MAFFGPLPRITEFAAGGTLQDVVRAHAAAPPGPAHAIGGVAVVRWLSQLAGALTHLGHTADQLSLLVAQQAERESIAFEEPIHDYIRMLASVKSALGARAKAKNALAAAQVRGRPARDHRASDSLVRARARARD